MQSFHFVFQSINLQSQTTPRLGSESRGEGTEGKDPSPEDQWWGGGIHTPSSRWQHLVIAARPRPLSMAAGGRRG